MPANNIFYAQSGGPTAVINATACGVIETARQHPEEIGTVFAGKNGILGALREELIDTRFESDADIAALKHTPASAFGSCRFKLDDSGNNHEQYERLIEVFEAHNISTFLYNGGNDSHDTANKIHVLSLEMGYPIKCLGLPKTIDNDLPITDVCPGFGSVAKYVAISTREAGLDVASMAASSTKIFILEVMGRHAGWIAAASGLAQEKTGDPPHIILFPEITFTPQSFLKRVEESVKTHDHCVIVVSEGVRESSGKFLTNAELTDAFGHTQLGGVAPIIAHLIKSNLGYKYHWAVSDYLQRSARHIASQVDVDHAYAIGKAAVEQALLGNSGIMLTIERLSSQPYEWTIGTAPLSKVANVERKMPRHFITEEGYHITDACREYMQPFIQGEAYPPYHNGLPQYVRLKNRCVEKRLEPINV